MSIKHSEDFIIVNDTTTVRISEIKAVEPESIVKFDTAGNIVARDFPKIIFITSDGNFQAFYETDEERDKDLMEIQEIIASNSAKNSDSKKSDSVNINVADSSNVNIVSGSSEVNITQELKNDVNQKIDEILSELTKVNNVNTELKEEVTDCVNDIHDKINNDKKIPKFTIKSLINLTSQISTISSLGLSLAKLLGG
jgi:hypothetical protein